MTAIHIFFEFKDQAWGGGNQFLKALRDYFRAQGAYTENPEEGDILLLNSHHFGDRVQINNLLSLKKNKPNLLIAHRIDGPVQLIRGRDEGTDPLIFTFANLFADAVVFQSTWSREHCLKLGLKPDARETVIMNAPDPKIFHPPARKTKSDKLRLIATSWSNNPRKGFDAYLWLDENLDRDKYDMTFVGNAPVKFRNILALPPQSSTELAETLRAHDVYITASRTDPCSNALIEAMHCGLPALALNDGGHPEIVGKGGLLFNRAEEIPAMLEKIQKNYETYQNNISLPDRNSAGKAYLDFLQDLHEETKSGTYTPKTPDPARVRAFARTYRKKVAPPGLALTIMQKGRHFAGQIKRKLEQK